MKKLLLGSIIVTSSVLGYVGVKNNYIPRIDTSKSGLVEYKIPNLTLIKDKMDKEILDKQVEQEKERLKRLEYIRKQNEIKQKKKEESLGKKVQFTLSFYTSLPSENGGHTVTCQGKKLRYGMVASNVYDIGTKIYLKGYGHFTVSDTGGSDFDENNRLDVLIERLPGEEDEPYKHRVDNMGKPVVTGYVKN